MSDKLIILVRRENTKVTETTNPDDCYWFQALYAESFPHGVEYLVSEDEEHGFIDENDDWYIYIYPNSRTLPKHLERKF
jgi:hypothetical protein